MKNEIDLFLEENNINSRLKIVSSIPNEEDSGFYIKLETLGNKHFMYRKDNETEIEFKNKVIQWLKLTADLFL